MNEKEVKEQIESIINDFIIDNDYRINATDIEALQAVLQLLDQKDKRIDKLEKVFIEESIKFTEEINKLKAEKNILEDLLRVKRC